MFLVPGVRPGQVACVFHVQLLPILCWSLITRLRFFMFSKTFLISFFFIGKGQIGLSSSRIFEWGKVLCLRLWQLRALRAQRFINVFTSLVCFISYQVQFSPPIGNRLRRCKVNNQRWVCNYNLMYLMLAIISFGGKPARAPCDFAQLRTPHKTLPATKLVFFSYSGQTKNPERNVATCPPLSTRKVVPQLFSAVQAYFFWLWTVWCSSANALVWCGTFTFVWWGLAVLNIAAHRRLGIGPRASVPFYSISTASRPLHGAMLDLGSSSSSMVPRNNHHHVVWNAFFCCSFSRPLCCPAADSNPNL